VRANKQMARTFCAFVFQPGEAFQFGLERRWLIGKKRTLKLQSGPYQAVHTSRAFLVRAYLLQTHELLFGWPTGMPFVCSVASQAEWYSYDNIRQLTVFGRASSAM